MLCHCPTLHARKTREELNTPFDVISIRSLGIYQAAQTHCMLQLKCAPQQKRTHSAASLTTLGYSLEGCRSSNPSCREHKPWLTDLSVLGGWPACHAAWRETCHSPSAESAVSAAQTGLEWSPSTGLCTHTHSGLHIRYTVQLPLYRISKMAYRQPHTQGCTSVTPRTSHTGGAPRCPQ